MSEPYGEVIAYLRLRGYLVSRFQAGRRPGVRMGATGWADIIGCSPTGGFIAVEVKSHGGEQSPGQLDFEYEVWRRGAQYFVCHGAEDLAEQLLNSKGIESIMRVGESTRAPGSVPRWEQRGADDAV